MEQKTKRKLYVYLPWVLILVVLGTVTLYSYYGKSYNPYETKFIKADLLSTMRSHLPEAIEAEKNAATAYERFMNLTGEVLYKPISIEDFVHAIAEESGDIYDRYNR